MTVKQKKSLPEPMAGSLVWVVVHTYDDEVAVYAASNKYTAYELAVKIAHENIEGSEDGSPERLKALCLAKGAETALDLYNDELSGPSENIEVRNAVVENFAL